MAQLAASTLCVKYCSGLWQQMGQNMMETIKDKTLGLFSTDLEVIAQLNGSLGIN